jgi:hypothetical protein
MRHQAAFFGLALAFAFAALFLIGACGHGSSLQEKAEKSAPSKEAVSKLLKTQIEAARKAHRAAVAKMAVKSLGGGLLVLVNSNHPNPEEVYVWSVRWLNAQRDLGEKQEDKIAAYADHQKRMKELQQNVDTLIGDTGVLLPFSAAAAAEWYLAEADLWLLQQRGK